jgi:hypothetical protein
MAFRRSTVRSRSAPPIPSETYADIGIPSMNSEFENEFEFPGLHLLPPERS